MKWYEEPIIKGWGKKERLPINHRTAKKILSKQYMDNSVTQAQADPSEILNKMRFDCPLCRYPNDITFPIPPDKVYTCPHCKTNFKMELY